MSIRLSVSCSRELREAMKNKNISPSTALKVGARRLLGVPSLEEGVEMIESTEKSQFQKTIAVMQKVILDLSDQLEEVRKKNGMV